MKNNIIVVLCLFLSVAFLAIGTVVGFSINKIEIVEKTETVETVETEWITKKSIYAVVEVDNDTLLYDKFVWVEDYHIYMPMSNAYQLTTGFIFFDYTYGSEDRLDEKIYYKHSYNESIIPGTSITKTETIVSDRYIFRAYLNRITADGFEWKDINSPTYVLAVNPDYE